MKRYLIILSLLLSSILYGQSGDWITYNVLNTAFPSNAYRAIVVDSSGNKWVGTEYKGVYKYDGTNWHIYNRENSLLPSDVINSLVSDSSRSIWIGTNGGGLAKLDTLGHWQIYNMNNSSLPNNDITVMRIDANGNKWIGTKNGGLAVLHPNNTWNVYNEENSLLPGNSITAIQFEKKDSLTTLIWVGTDNGLLKIDGSQWTVYNTSNSNLTGGNTIVCLLIDKNKTKWFGLYNRETNIGGGLTRLDSLGVWTLFTKENSGLPSNSVYSLALERESSAEVLWIGTSLGLAKLNGTAWTVYTKVNTNGGLASDIVLSLGVEDNIKWIGTNNNIIKFTGVVWSDLSLSNSGIPSNTINQIYIEKKSSSKNYWFCTGMGLSKFDGREWTVLNTTNSALPSNNVRTLTIDTNGDKWIGLGQYYYEFGGLVQIDSTNAYTVYNTTNSQLPYNEVTSIVIDKFHNKWVGTKGGGLAIIDQTYIWTIFNDGNSLLPSNEINCLNIDKFNNKWVGTKFGLVKIDSLNVWHLYNTFNSGLMSNDIRAICIDGKNTKWIGTASGLYKFDGVNWSAYNTSNSGLPSNEINSISYDIYNIKWVGTALGLVKTDGLNWSIFNMSNSEISGNLVNYVTIDFAVENNIAQSYKFVGTQTGGVSVYKGGNSIYPRGIYLSVLPSPVYNTFLNFAININSIFVDSLSFKINQVRVALSEIANNGWFAHYQAPESGDFTLAVKAFFEGKDSTLVKNISIALLDSKNFRYENGEIVIEKSGTVNTEPMCIYYDKSPEVAEPEAGAFQVGFAGQNLPEPVKISFKTNHYTGIEQFNGDRWVSVPVENIEDKLVWTTSFMGLFRPTKNSVAGFSELKGNYPNPFNPETTILFSLNRLDLNSPVLMRIYNVKGQKVCDLNIPKPVAGENAVVWNGENNQNQMVSSGLYFCRLVTKSGISQKKMVLIK